MRPATAPRPEFGYAGAPLPFHKPFAVTMPASVSPEPARRQPDGAAARPMQWDAAYDIGLSAIDDQHRKLVELANRLLEHPEAGVRDEAVVDILTRLGKALAIHFRGEELIMRELGMPARRLDAHVRDHDRILDQYAELNIGAAAGAPYRAADVFAQVIDWVGRHMLEHDLGIKDYLPA